MVPLRGMRRRCAMGSKGEMRMDRRAYRSSIGGKGGGGTTALFDLGFIGMTVVSPCCFCTSSLSSCDEKESWIVRKDELLVILDVVSSTRDAALALGGGAADLLSRGRIVKEEGRLMTTTAAGRKMNDVCASKNVQLM